VRAFRLIGTLLASCIRPEMAGMMARRLPAAVFVLLPTLTGFASAFVPNSPGAQCVTRRMGAEIPRAGFGPARVWSTNHFARSGPRLFPLQAAPEVQADVVQLEDRLNEIAALSNETVTFGWALSQTDSSGGRDRDGTWVTRDNPRLEELRRKVNETVANRAAWEWLEKSPAPFVVDVASSPGVRVRSKPGACSGASRVRARMRQERALRRGPRRCAFCCFRQGPFSRRCSTRPGRSSCARRSSGRQTCDRCSVTRAGRRSARPCA